MKAGKKTSPSASGSPRTKTVIETTLFVLYLVVFIFFLAQSRWQNFLPSSWKLNLVNEELQRESFYKAYRELLEENPEDPIANWVVGTYYAKRGECSKAVQLLEHALRLGLQLRTIYDWLVRCYTSLGDSEKARKYLQEREKSSLSQETAPRVTSRKESEDKR